MVHGLETMKKLNDAVVARGPLSELKAALHANEDYAWTWLCNLAGIGMDSGGDHESANRYAAQFMKNAFGVDVRTQENWKGFESQWRREESDSVSVVCDTKSDLAIAELVDLLHNRFRWPRPTKVVINPGSVLFNLNAARYMAFPNNSVLEVRDDKVGETLASLYTQGVLRGGKRTEDGTLIVKGEQSR